MTDTEKLQQAKRIIQQWVDQQGHERCWYYPDLFRELVELFELQSTQDPLLPPRPEFELGCRRYQDEEYNKT